MPSIGDHTFVTLAGEVEPFRLGIVPFSRPGVDGVGAEVLGERSPQFTLRSTVDVDSLSAGKSAYAGYLEDVGSVVSVEAGDGQTYANVLILDVQRIRLRTALRIAGGISSSKAAVLVCEWTLQLVGSPGA